jgi:hypothetical protein
MSDKLLAWSKLGDKLKFVGHLFQTAPVPRSFQRLTGRDVPMEMLRILIFSQICDYAPGPMLIYHAGSNLPNYLKQLEQQLAILITEREQRIDMMFGNYDNMNRVKGTRVVEGQHILGVHNSLDGSASAQDFVAVEVIHVL